MKRNSIKIIFLGVFLLFSVSCNSTENNSSLSENNLDEHTTDTNSELQSSIDTDTDKGKLLDENERILDILGEEPTTFDEEKDYSDWKEMYYSIVYDNLANYDYVYYLAYIDDDDYPELIQYYDYANMTRIWSWKDPNEFEDIRGKIAFTEKRGFILSEDSYLNKDGMRKDYLFLCKYANNDVVEYGSFDDTDSSWEIFSIQVEKEAYDLINQCLDFKNITILRKDNCYSSEEIINVIKTGHDSSYSHRYEIVLDDVSWEEARDKSIEKGGYLAVITSYPELMRIKELMDDNSKENSAYYIGCQKDDVEKWYLPDGNMEKVGGGSIHVDITGPGNSWFEKMLGEYKKDDLKYGMAYYHYGLNEDEKIYMLDLYYAPLNLSNFNPEVKGRTGYIIEYNE